MSIEKIFSKNLELSLSHKYNDILYVYREDNIWKNFVEKVMSIFSISEEDLDSLLSTYSFNPSTDYVLLDMIKHLLKVLINHEGGRSRLWEDIFTLKLVELSSPYETQISISFKLNTKEFQISKMDSLWVYQNHSKVEEFMNETEIYNKLKKISV